MNYLLYIKVDINETYFIKSLQNIIEKKLFKEINIYNLSKENNNELYIYNFIYENRNRYNDITSCTSIEIDTDTYIKNILINIEKYVKIFFPEYNDKWKINYNLIKQ